MLTGIFLVIQLVAQSVQIIGTGKRIDPYHYTIRKYLGFSKAAVVCAHPLAAEVGTEIMREGGNAFDAAIAVNFTLAVVFPGAGNIGGCGFMMARKTDGSLIALDYREQAPARATRDMYLDPKGNPRTDLSQNGPLSVGVPATVAGLLAMYRYARLPFRTLIQPAIDLAAHGFAITAAEAASLNATRTAFLTYSTRPTAFVKKELWKAGDTLVQKELAQTLIRIRDQGRKGFYEGETARLIVEEMKRGHGIISLADLKNYQAKLRKPVVFTYRGYQIASFPPPSSGGILLAQMLKMVAPYPLNQYGFESIRATHLMIEAERRAFADRATYLGDPDYWKVPVQALTSDRYLLQRMADFDPLHASESTGIHSGTLPESEETTHMCIQDPQGNIVSITTTLNNWYGSRTVVGGAGFLLNDEMDDFSIKPGVPNMYGAIGDAANAIAPGKRMLSSMTPTLVLKDNHPFMVVGTPGGTTIPTSVFQTIVDIIDFGMDATDAVDKPKFHHQWLPDQVMIEKSFPDSTRRGLEKMGYILKERSSIGRTELILTGSKGKEAVADDRGDDSVSGF